MSFPMTQIVLPSNIRVNLNPTPTTNVTVWSIFSSDININGSNCIGKYLFNHKLIQFSGSGGGNLLGLPEIILLNIYGTLKETSINLEFSGLLQITINGNRGELSLSKSYFNYYNGNGNSNGTIISNEFELSETQLSVICANNNRYINIGELEITFPIT